MGSTRVLRLLGNLLTLAFVAGGLFFGYLYYTSIRDIFAYYPNLPILIGGPVRAGPLEGQAEGNPVSERRLTDRVNILLLGIDRRDNDRGPWRSDTMILFSIDPVDKRASMMSIPRDLWVPLPDFGLGRTEDRINAAHAYGDQYKYPGGGLALAKEAIRYNLGIRVHYGVRIDFRTFVRLVDEIGGIDVDVPADIEDNEYPTADHGTTRIFFAAGRQHLDGERALQYVRTRYADSDLHRARRQQQAIMAVRNKLLSLNYSLDRIPTMLSIVGEGVRTDMTLDEMLAVARAAQEVQEIRQGVIDESMTVSARTPGGADVLLPERDKIRELVNRLFPVSTPVPPAGPLGDRQRLGQEAARIEVQNGTDIPGLASRTAAGLRAAGYNVVRYGDAGRPDYQETAIICFTESRYTLASLKAELKVADALVLRQASPGADVDIRVILGRDAATW